ncbi:hypothetical protein FOPG_20171 [Fusarium oxysporum f. sp. conglutinans race 2 54008]|uniref:Uncharacterized protein n=1 Tax=Fusarium oxysporum f. sp. conglutinans race 2 54008 TaxID=1089457 RepID=X0GUG0_FUSOX|nr:hypothetical protein FOPG_20171 [Fusarium oxysporum f. sp. conglutinans race 2 54008]
MAPKTASIFNNTELRMLLISPLDAIYYMLSASSFYLDISGSAPSIFPRMTDLRSLLYQLPLVIPTITQFLWPDAPPGI